MVGWTPKALGTGALVSCQLRVLMMLVDLGVLRAAERKTSLKNCLNLEAEQGLRCMSQYF